MTEEGLLQMIEKLKPDSAGMDLYSKPKILLELGKVIVIVKTIEKCIERRGLGWCYEKECKNRKSCIIYINGGSTLNLLGSKEEKK